MSNEVYANGMEVSCKAAAGKSICAFPDVCFTPPQTPATPPGVPIPYPNTGMASDTSSGSTTVQISGQEVMLKDSSYFKQSTGDEAGCAPKKNVITSVNKGKCYYTAWSMDVKFEGENAVRHLDMMTHNHASGPGATPPWPYADAMASPATQKACEKDKKKAAKKCAQEKDWKKNCPPSPPYPESDSEAQAYANACQKNACLNARKCMLVPYKPDSGCCPGQTGHHIVESASFLEPDGGGKRSNYPPIEGWKNYDTDKAPCVCAEGTSYHKGTHAMMHLRTGALAMDHQNTTGSSMWSREQATQAGVKAFKKTFPSSNCSEECLKAQLNEFHDKAKSEDPEKPIKAVYSSETGYRDIAAADMGVAPP